MLQSCARTVVPSKSEVRAEFSLLDIKPGALWVQQGNFEKMAESFWMTTEVFFILGAVAVASATAIRTYKPDLIRPHFFDSLLPWSRPT